MRMKRLSSLMILVQVVVLLLGVQVSFKQVACYQSVVVLPKSRTITTKRPTTTSLTSLVTSSSSRRRGTSTKLQAVTAFASSSPLFRSDFSTSRSASRIASRSASRSIHGVPSRPQTRSLGKLHCSASSTIAEQGVDKNEHDNDNDENGGLGAWLPLASVSCMKGLGPQRVTLMNLDLVVWHTSPDNSKDNSNKDNNNDIEWSVQIDACAHRLAPLSQGRVNPNNNCIECPYHGWTFDTEGNVTSIPQLDDGTTLSNILRANANANNDKNTNNGIVNNGSVNLQTFPTHIVGDLLFVFLPTCIHGEMFPQSLLPETYYPFVKEELMSQQQQQQQQNGNNKKENKNNNDDSPNIFVRDLPYSFDFVVENFMDPAHIPFAHHKLQSTRDDGSSIEMKEMESNFTLVKTSFKDMTQKRKRDAYAAFQRPSFYHYAEKKGDLLNEQTNERSGNYEASLCIFITPIKAGYTRIFFKSPPIKRFPLWLLHAGSNRFLNSDVWLHDTERAAIQRKEDMMRDSGGSSTSSSNAANDYISRKLCQLDYQYQSKSDLGVSSFRKWWKKNGMADSPKHTFRMSTMDELGPTPLSRAQQIDPWVHHSKHCSICRKSLVRMKQLQTFSLFFAFGSCVLFNSRFNKPLLGLLGAGFGIVGHNFLKRFATVIEGNPEASGIADRSSAASAS